MGESGRRDISITIEVETKLKSGKYPMITLPSKVLRDLYSQSNTALFKLTIRNDVEIEYFWEYNPNKKPYLVFKELKGGKYKVTIEPYFLHDFIKEINSKICEKKISMSIENDHLVVELGKGFRIITNDWRFEKEHGGSVHIVASFPSPTRHGEKALLKFQIKRGEAKIYLLEKQGERKRLSPHPVLDINPLENYVEIKYKHGDRAKTTIIVPIRRHQPSIDRSKPLEILEIRRERIGEYKVVSMGFIVKDKGLADTLNQMMIESIKYYRRGMIRNFKLLRERIGKIIAQKYFEMLGFDELIFDPVERRGFVYRAYFGSTRPDLLIFKDDEMYIIEIKFRYNRKSGEEALIEAVDQVVNNLRDMESTTMTYRPPYLIDNRRITKIKLITFIVGYNHRKIGGYILKWERKYEEW